MIRRRYLFPVGAAALALSIAAATTGWASWSTSGTGSGQATVGSIEAPADVAVSTGNPAVIEWSAAHLTPSNGAVQGYTVTRTGPHGEHPDVICGSPDLVTDLTCTDTSPADEDLYIVTAEYRTWTAASDPQGAEPIRAGGFAAPALADVLPSDPASPTPTGTPSASPSPTAPASASASPTPTPTPTPTDAASPTGDASPPA